MKKMLIGAALILGSFGLAQRSEAQIRLGVNINIGDQPSWRVPGHDYVEYYYLPDIETYYYVPRHQFVYLSNGRWVFSYNLPPRHRGYNLNTGYKVVVNQHNAYQYYNQHRTQYGRQNRYHKNNNNGRHRGWKNHR
ncbi:MAG TPA: hypothetical protein VGO58_09875 [Chitinophagaceae bacterium]|nr:hypothetical protein [Chitinophagaceae bacterium]